MFEPLYDRSNTSLDFVAALRQGHPDAWQEFFAYYGPAMLARCRRIGFQDADAEDVAADFLLKVRHGLVEKAPGEKGGFEHDPPRFRFRYWLRVLFKRTCLDLQRELAQSHEKSNQALLLGSLAASFDDEQALETHDVDMQQALAPYLSHLEKHFRSKRMFNALQILFLKECQDWTYEEVATELGLKPDHVRQILSRLRKKLPLKD